MDEFEWDDIVRATEEAFGIRLLCRDLEGVDTVGDLHSVILSKLAESSVAAAAVAQPRRCLTSAAFFRLRRALIEVAGVPKPALRPESELTRLLPWYGRRRLWSELRRATGLRLPPLYHPSWVILLLLATSVTLILMPFAYGLMTASVTAALAAGLAAFVIFVLLMGHSEFLAFVPAFPTLGETVRMVAALNYRELAGEQIFPRSREVWKTLCFVISKEACAEGFEFYPEMLIADAFDMANVDDGRIIQLHLNGYRTWRAE